MGCKSSVLQHLPLSILAHCIPGLFPLQVITSATYKTHPNPAHVQVAIAQFNTTEASSLRTVREKIFQAIPGITDAGYTGYATMGESRDFGNSSLQAVFIRPNGTNETFNEVFSPLIELADMPGVEAGVFPLELPSWIEYCDQFLRDPNIATNIMDPSRLLTADVLLNRTSDLADLLSDYKDYGGGFNFSKRLRSHVICISIKGKEY